MEWEKKVKKIAENLDKLDSELDEIKNNKIYENAFEWRFEFPEVLNDYGEFIGFDIVLGNPPYIRQESLGSNKLYLEEHYQTFAGTADIYVYFVERGMNILARNGNFIYILPNKWLRAGYGKNLRAFLQRQRLNTIIDFNDLPVFEEATTYPCILTTSKSLPRETLFMQQILKRYHFLMALVST